jgi:hypothetical protein
MNGFVRYAYFLGADDPYSELKTTLKAEPRHGRACTASSVVGLLEMILAQERPALI